jgi:hypothetical protein
MTRGPELLHVTNGDSAGGTLRQTSPGGAGAVLPWRDALHEGPVPAGPRAGLLAARAAFLSGCGWGSGPAVQSALERRDRQLLRALRDGVPVVLWFEHDLYDQLQLIDVLALAAGAGAGGGVGSPGGGGPGTLELIVVGEFPGRPSFRGLGELTAAELETLWPSRVAAGPAALDAATRAWAALRRTDPSDLAGCARDDVPELPFLSAALRRLLEELPAPADGLSGTERRALQAVAAGGAGAAGAVTAGRAFVAAQDLEEAPFAGDTWFFRALAGLGRGPSRLVETGDGQPLGDPPPLGDARSFAGQPLRLTPAGRQVLAGQADRAGLLGLDRWLGGTHLTPATAWRWDPATGQLIPPS